MTDAPSPSRPFRIFDVDDRFRTMAMRRGGLTREQALRGAEKHVVQSAPQFNNWLDQDIDALRDTIRAAAAGTAEADWRVRAAEQAAGVRDIARTLNFAILSSIASALATVLEAAESGRETKLDALERHVEAIILTRRRTQAGEPTEHLAEVDENLRRVVSRARAES